MSAILSYSIAVSLGLMLMYGVTRLCLVRTTFYRQSRFALLVSLFTSLAIPFLAGPLADCFVKPAVVAQTIPVDLGSNVVVVPLAQPERYGAATPLWLRIAVVVYAVGVAFFLVRYIWSAMRLARVIRNSHHIGQAGKWQIRVHSLASIGAFSFGRCIILPEEEYNSGISSEVIVHESEHLARRHWIDLMFADLVACICWYCPAVWMLRRDISVAHEYEADGAVIASGADATAYQIMLIKKATGSRFPSIACYLTYKSTISKRVKMMLKTKSSPWPRRVAAVALPAVAGLSLMALTSPAMAGALARVSDAKVTNISPNAQVSERQSDLSALPDSLAEKVVIEEIVTAGDSVHSERRIIIHTPDTAALSEVRLVSSVTHPGDSTHSGCTVNYYVPVDTIEGEYSGTRVVAYKIVENCVGEESMKREPVVVIDGVISSYAEMQNIPSEDIKSLSILKDSASMAKYADDPRSKNGVIIVETEKHPSETTEKN